MSTLSHERPAFARPAWLELPEFWAAISIVVIWLAVLFDGVFGPSIVSGSDGSGVPGTGSVVPSVVAVAPCGVLATWLIARHAFRREPRS